MHTVTLVRLEAPAEVIEALRAQKPLADARSEALRSFTLAVMDHRGAVGDEETRAFLGAGYTPQNALEVVLGVGAYTISTFANRLIDAPRPAVPGLRLGRRRRVRVPPIRPLCAPGNPTMCEGIAALN